MFKHTLSPNRQVRTLGYDYFDDDSDPFPPTIAELGRDSHGTNVAGVIAMAKSNDDCGIGVAYQSTITGNVATDPGLARSSA